MPLFWQQASNDAHYLSGPGTATPVVGTEPPIYLGQRPDRVWDQTHTPWINSENLHEAAINARRYCDRVVRTPEVPSIGPLFTLCLPATLRVLGDDQRNRGA